MINEFLPDPNGSDAGREFVELLNTGPDSLNLLNLEFQFANGAVGPEWTTRWHMDSDHWLAAGERFLLADRNWQEEVVPDVEVYLGLQNGPDAIRLFRQGEVIDMVGYGALTDTELMEGTAVPLVTGMSLARRPDGTDSNNNFDDFVAAAPTPGFPNFNEYELQVDSVEWDPPSLTHAGQILQLSLVLKNVGVENISTVPLKVQLRSEWDGDETVLETLFAGCPTSEECPLFLEFTSGRTGSFRIILELSLSAEDSPFNLDVGSLQVGAGTAFLSEVMWAPSNHQGEWVEIQAGDEMISLDNFKIRDEGGTWKNLPAMEVGPGQLVVVAQDSSALAQWHQNNIDQGLVLDCLPGELTRVLRQMPGSWPSLNNNPPEDRSFADRVYLGDISGAILDHVTLPGTNSLPDNSGLSWERMSHHAGSSGWLHWRSSTAPQGGTPGCPNSVGDLQTTDVELVADPPILDLEMGFWVTHLRFTLDTRLSHWHVEIFDLWGTMVRDLGGGQSGQGTREMIWDGKDDFGRRVPAGGYVVLLLKGGNDQSLRPVAKTLVVVR